MPQQNNIFPNEPKKSWLSSYSYLFHNYLFSYLYYNGTLIIGHPADRLKVAVQVDLNQSQMSLLRPLVQGNYSNLYKGFWPSFLRQNSKMCYRTFLISTLPHQIDNYQLSPLNSCLIKTSVASIIDTMLTTPLENIKTRQMKAVDNVSMMTTAKSIYKQNGFPGFFSGTSVSFSKSFPSWMYLFLGYHATKDKREKQNFLHTIFWSTAASIPIALATNPLDVIKSQKQAGLRPINESSIQCAKALLQNHGALSFWRGFPFRLLHKSLETVISYTVMDRSSKIQSQPENTKKL